MDRAENFTPDEKEIVELLQSYDPMSPEAVATVPKIQGTTVKQGLNRIKAEW
jgi:hypothetical protein